MNKKEIIDSLEIKHNELFKWLKNHPDEKWILGPESKWTTGQHLLHLVISLRMLNKALSMPKFILKYKFGKFNRPSRSYEQVAKRYEERLVENQKRAQTFNKDLKTPSLEEKEQIQSSLQILNKKLQYKTNQLKDTQLDTILLPHPLMGKMTLREIIMWAAHHTEHHVEILKKHY